VNVLDRRVKCFRKYVVSFEAHFASPPCNLKLKCNNLTFNEILSLHASYVYLWHSRLESPDLYPGRRTPHF
jgi:hypothetical protein